MTPITQQRNSSDIERGFSQQSSSSYGSLDLSTISVSAQYPDRYLPPSSSGGLSMHINEQTEERIISVVSTTASSPSTAATNAVNATYGAGGFDNDNDNDNDNDDNDNDDHHNQDNHNDIEDSHHPAHEDHLINSRQYYRDMILGVNDGLVSTFLLVAGVVGGGMNVSAVLLTAISGAIAGAISMFAGEYIATKSQNEVLDGELKLEAQHIRQYHAEEMQELAHLLTLIGIPGSKQHLSSFEAAAANNDQTTTATEHTANINRARKTRKLRRRITQYYASNPAALLKIMIALEFGVIDEEVRSPAVAGGTSFIVFVIGSLTSVVPFACVSDTNLGLVISGLACGIGLFFVGAVKTWATRGVWWRAALENLMITAAGGAIAYGIGVGFDTLVND